MGKGWKPPNGFDKDPERASRAGKKSSRALPQDLKEARVENANAFESTIYKYLKFTAPELRTILSDPTTPARDLVVIKILARAIEQGDHQRLNFLLERTIGKVVERVEATVTNKDETAALGAELLEILRSPK